MPESLAEMKSQLRRRMRRILRSMTPEERAASSGAIVRTIAKLPAWRDAERVLCFLSMPEEVDLEDLIAAGVRAGKSLYAPLIKGEDIEFRRIPPALGTAAHEAWTHASWTHASWTRGPFGIREPDPDWEALDLESPLATLVLVPGLAFDRAGSRLGRGKGYYDRFLSSIAPERRSGWLLIAPCFGVQVVEEVPRGPKDVVMDALATEAGWIRIPPPRG
jgi:5-formyltetrahydrofolate cyclo-ligase